MSRRLNRAGRLATSPRAAAYLDAHYLIFFVSLPPIASWSASGLITAEPVLDPDTVRAGAAEGEISLIQTRRLEPDRVGTWPAAVEVFAVPVVDEVSSLSAKNDIGAAVAPDAFEDVVPTSSIDTISGTATHAHVASTT